MIRALVISLAVLLLGIGGDVMAKPAHVHEQRTAAIVSALPPVADSCRPATWKSVSPDVVAQAADLIKQYNAASDQLAKLGVSGPDNVMVLRPDIHTGWVNPKSAIYEGNWSEVREALQAMLNKRLAGLSCKLQVIGVDMTRPKNSEISSR